MEKFTHYENPRKQELKTEFGALKKDWIEKNGLNLDTLKFSELKSQINAFYEENRDAICDTLEKEGESLESELSNLSSKKLDSTKVSLIREKIGIPKKVPLSETVAFIKTVVDLDEQKLKEKYFQYCSEGISLDDMRRVLAFDNDVKPARLDTDIYHQSPQRSRSAVEIVSNAIDALKKDGNTIGRFGIGFYQILSHLQDKEDYVRVETGDKKNGFYTLEFSLKEKEIQISLEKNENQKTAGTSVTLHAKEFPKEEAEGLIKKHFAYNNVAEVFCNGEKVNDLKSFDIEKKELPKIGIEINEEGYKVVDDGVGMSPQVILEKLIVPKFSGKQSVREILNKENINSDYIVERRKDPEDKSHGKTVLNVGGVMIEEIEISGINSAKTVVIDLPSFTMLGEERNEVAVDEITISAVKKIIEKATDEKDIAVLNSLAPLIQKLQDRSLNHKEENNLLRYLQIEADNKLDKNLYYLPNIDGFERIETENVVLLDPNIKQTHWNKIPDFYIPNLTGSGKVVFAGPLRSNIDSPIIEHGNRLLLDSHVHKSLQDDPTLINLYLNAKSNATGDKIRRIEKEEKENNEKEDNKKEQNIFYNSPEDFVQKEWKLLGFLTEGSALAYCENLQEKLEKKHSVDIITKYFINTFPKNVSKYLFSQASQDSNPRENWTNNEKILNSILTITQNKELVELLDELDINILNYREKKYEKYPDFNPTPKEIEDPQLKGWDFVYYYGYGNLVDPNGKVYQNIQPDGMNISKASYRSPYLEGQTKAILDGILFTRDEGDLYFMDFNSKEQRKIFEANGENKWETARDSDKKPRILFLDDKKIVPLMNHGSFSSRTFKEFPESIIVQDTQFIDFDTGDIFNPKPNLGNILGYNNEAIIYSSAKDRWNEDGKTIYTAYYLADGSTKVLHRDDSKNYKTLQERVGAKFTEVIESNDKVSTLINGKEVASFSTRFYEKIINDRARFGQSTWNLDWYIEEGLSVEERTLNGDNFILYRNVLSKGSKEKRLGGDNPDYIYRGDKSECVLFDKDGNEIFHANPDEYVKFHNQKNGEPVLLCLSFNQEEVYVENSSYIKDFSNIKDLVFRDLSGNVIEGENLKNLDPIFFKTGGRHQKHSYYKSYHEGALSPYQGNKWKVEVIEGSHPSGYSDGIYKDQSIHIVERETGKEIFPYSFSYAIYKPEKDQWECKIFETELRNFGEKDDTPVEKIIYINNQGQIVGNRELAGQSDLSKYSEYDLEIAGREYNPLSKEKIDVIHRLLSANSEETKEEIERFIGRCFKYGNLDDKSFAQIAPILLKVEEINPLLIENNTISSLEGRLARYDTETKAWFYTFLSKMTKDEEEGKEIFVEKFIKIFENKIAHLPQSEKEKVFETLDQVRDYRGEYLTTGWNIIKSKSPVPSELIPEKIRPLIDFLRMDEKESMSTTKEEIEFKSKASISLSQLIQTKRLNETRIKNFDGSVDNLLSLVEDKTKGKKQDHIQREIIHPIYYQGVNNPYLFIRELVQNAHDAIIIDPESSRKEVTIDIFSRDKNEVTLRMEDGAGMSLQELLNYFLIPGETTKLDDEKTIGFFGQGLFTLFRGSKEVVIKTSKGDDSIQKLKITPKLGIDGGVEDLNLIFEQEKGVYKGTTIERTIATEFPTVESSYVKNATCTYTSLVEGSVIDIELNGAKINAPQNTLATIKIPELGDLKLYDAPNNVITQRGLFIKGIDSDYGTKVKDVEELLEKRGYVVNLPDTISLTRSRNEIAQKEGVLPEIQKYLPLLKLKAYIEIFRQDIVKGQVIQLANLPYDYFFMSYSPNREIEEDAQKITQGQPIENVDRYLERGSLIHLLVLLPAVEIDGKGWSISELKEASLNNTTPLENESKYRSLPSFLREKLLAGKAEHNRMESSMRSAEERGDVVDDFSFDSLDKQPAFIQEQVKESYDQYKRMSDYLEKHNEILAKSYDDKKKPGTTFYSEPNSKAHASKMWSFIGWNLDYWKGWALPFKEENPSDERLSNFLETYTHEYTHVKEKSSHMTHNQDFYKMQANIISRLINIKLKENI